MTQTTFRLVYYYVYFIIVTDITFTSIQYQSLVKIVQYIQPIYGLPVTFVYWYSKNKRKIYLYSLLWTDCAGSHVGSPSQVRLHVTENPRLSAQTDHTGCDMYQKQPFINKRLLKYSVLTKWDCTCSFQIKLRVWIWTCGNLYRFNFQIQTKWRKLFLFVRKTSPPLTYLINQPPTI